MSTQQKTSIEGRFVHLVYSPHGGIEGVLLDADGRPVQIVFDHDDEQASRPFERLSAGQSLVIDGTARGPSPKGESEHPVYDFVRLKSVDGIKPEPKRDRGAAYRGVVERFNYARHGAANGVVLDSGDFIHTKPDGLTRLKLRIGDRVEADGDAYLLATGARLGRGGDPRQRQGGQARLMVAAAGQRPRIA